MKKLKEHYGVEVGSSMARKITEAHGVAFSGWTPERKVLRVKQLIGELDGSMIPIVETDPKTNEQKDLRKTRRVFWKEAKLCFARDAKKIDRIYTALIGTAEEAGNNLRECAKQVGLAEDSKIHVVSDGAQWIVDQVEEQFGPQAYFLVDFFHVCEYLAEAAIWCNVEDPHKWLEETKQRLKEGEEEKIVNELEKKMLQLENPDQDHPLIKSVRYMKKRLKHMDYKGTLEKNLPIGSGEIESSHRHVIQKRLKIAGAWWRVENANAMLGLRTARLNGYWEGYWEHLREAA